MNKQILTCVSATDPRPAEWTTLVRSDEAGTIAESVRARGSSFFRAMRLLPPARRLAAYALYAFCREVDDIADGQAPRALKLSLLSHWRAEIGRLYAGRPRHLTTRCLSHAAVSFPLQRPTAAPAPCNPRAAAGSMLNKAA